MFDFKSRDSEDNIRRQSDSIVHSPRFISLLEDIPNMIIIMNQHRQIVYMNRKFTETVGKRGGNGKTGIRPGECLLCIHAMDAEFGCGSTDFCRVCGFANAIEKSSRGAKASGECNITLDHGETLTFRVHTRPFEHLGNRFIFAYMQDISDFKTRQMLENIFLHDINNSITALNGLNELIEEMPLSETKSIINDLSLRLTDEIYSYRLICEAENQSLSVIVSEVNVDRLIDNVIKTLTNNRFMRDRKIQHNKSGVIINTDETLLRRVLINTIKNALEVSNDDQEIEIFSEKYKKDSLYSINVRSQPLIPRNVQLQLFQRAYSTKGPGRGWGTYSIRLLTEKYLGGKVDFVSNKEQRTLFSINIPDLQN